MIVLMIVYVVMAVIAVGNVALIVFYVQDVVDVVRSGLNGSRLLIASNKVGLLVCRAIVLISLMSLLHPRAWHNRPAESSTIAVHFTIIVVMKALEVVLDGTNRPAVRWLLKNIVDRNAVRSESDVARDSVLAEKVIGTAHELADKVIETAVELEKRTVEHFDVILAKTEEAKEAAHKAYKEANNVNAKIENLQSQLLTETKARQAADTGTTNVTESAAALATAVVLATEAGQKETTDAVKATTAAVDRNTEATEALNADNASRVIEDKKDAKSRKR